ncbi:condensation domain-containing protein, partial [Actinomadura rubrobrunea]
RPRLRRQERPERIPLSFAQRRLWFLHRLEGPSPTYNIPFVLKITGPLNHDALHAAVHDVVHRHEALRTVFPDDRGEPYQHILPAHQTTVPWEHHHLDEHTLTHHLTQAARHPFDLSRDIPIRVTVFQTAPHDNTVLLLIHHIAGDGWSLRPLLRDLATAYQARLDGQTPQWPPLPVQYADYTLWQQRQLLAGENTPGTLAHTQLQHWRTTLTDLPEQIPL